MSKTEGYSSQDEYPDLGYSSQDEDEYPYLGYPLYEDWGVVTPLLTTELRKEAQSLIDSGVTPDVISQVFENILHKVIKKITSLAISMHGFDMKAVLSDYYATQLPKQLFHESRSHIATIIVDAVYASGYDYDCAGPYEYDMSDFEDGFNLIGIKKVLGGHVDDSFSVEGICIAFKPHVDGFENLGVVKNPEILILKDMSIEVKLIDILKRGPNVVLTSRAFDGEFKQELAKRCIYIADLVSEYDLNRVAKATCAETIPFNHKYPQRIQIGTCKSFQQKIFGNEVFGIFSGCPRGNVATVVLYGDDQFIEKEEMYEAELYVRELIPEVRTVMKARTLVDGGRNLYYNIIQYVREEANYAETNSKQIINAFAKAIQAASDNTYDNDGCNPSQENPNGWRNIVWEAPSVKLHTIYGAGRVVCAELLNPYRRSWERQAHNGR